MVVQGGNPGPGGYGVAILDDNILEYKYSEQFENVTNNQMELRAIIHALKWIQSAPAHETYTIYSDSAYCVNMINSWIWTWKINNWQNSKKQTVENLELVQELYSLLDVNFPNFAIEKCSGHIGITGNELADALASNNQAKFTKIKSENNIRDKYEIFI